MNGFVTIFYDWSRAFASYFTWAAPLAVRITVGWVFMGTGYNKLTHLPVIVKNFAGMGLPSPEILAPFVSGVEFFGGMLLFAGLLTRFAAVPLMIVMVVAIISAKLGDIDSIETLLGFDEFEYLALFLWLAIAGPGVVSVDHLIMRMTGRAAKA